jgi:hypothetical protein
LEAGQRARRPPFWSFPTLSNVMSIRPMDYLGIAAHWVRALVLALLILFILANLMWSNPALFLSLLAMVFVAGVAARSAVFAQHVLMCFCLLCMARLAWLTLREAGRQCPLGNHDFQQHDCMVLWRMICRHRFQIIVTLIAAYQAVRMLIAALRSASS